MGGSPYTYLFNLENDNLAAGIEEISVYFDRLLYEDLRDVIAPDNWDPLVIQPEPELFGDGFADFLSRVSPLGIGQTLAFEITFDFIGIDAPGNLFFDVIDSLDFSVIDAGFTTAAGSTTHISEPGTLALFGIGLFGMGLERRKKV